MEKPDEIAEKEAWGTWEELLLAFAVNRYGSKSWDSVAGEIQKRSSKMTPFLSPCNCKQKFHDLKRRYTHELARHQNDAVGDDKTEIEIIPWLDELRKLRITELKRELEHYDLSIVSLQSKVKRLKEEKDESLRASENGGEDQLDPEEREIYTEPEKLSPKSVVCKLITTDELDRHNQSVAQSNSTDPKSENVETGEVKMENDPELVRTADENRQLASGSEKPVREESCNGSSDSIAKEMVQATSVKVEQDGGASESPELWESVAESKGSAEKESSDVQSSASKLKKEESDRLHCGSSGGDERETEDQSPPALKGTFVKSQPLVDFLEILWSHKLGSIFERLLESQETSKYRNLIRQNIDLKSIKRNVEEGWYLDCEHKFFRDLLLLANNAMVFFGKKSSESIAATELRQIISMEMAQRNAKAELSDGKQTSLLRLSLQSKQVQEPCDSLLLKPQMAGIITVCRKRSSIAAAKGSASFSGSDRKREQTAALAEYKPALEFKQTSKSSAIAENNRITKKRTRDGSASSSRSSEKNSKTLANTDYDKNFAAITNQNEGTVGSPTEHSQPKSEKNTITAEVKKRSAANFLDRLKRTLSPNSGSFLDTSKSSMLSVEKDKGIPEKKRSDSIKGDENEDKVTKRSSRGRQPNEESSPTKRRLGRPPKRAAAPSSVMAESRKRAIGDTAVEASKHPKKKSRK